MTRGRISLIAGGLVCSGLLLGSATAQEKVGIVGITDGEGRRVIFQVADPEGIEGGRKAMALPEGAFPKFPGGQPAFNPGIDAEQIRQQAARTALDSLQQTLGSPDEEWSVLKPRIQAVQALQAAMGNRGKLMVAG